MAVSWEVVVEEVKLEEEKRVTCSAVDLEP